MPPKKTKAARPPAAPPEEPIDEFEDEPADEVDALLAELGGEGGSVKVYEVESDGKVAFLTTVAADTFTMEWLKDEYGAGKYELRLKKGAQFAGTKRVKIGGRRAAAAATAAAPSALEAQVAQLTELVRQLATQQHAPQPATSQDPMQLATQIGAIAATNMAAMVKLFEGMGLGAGGKSGSSIKETLELISLARDLNGDAAPAREARGTDWPAMITALTKLVDHAKERAAELAQPAGAPQPEAQRMLPGVSRWLPLRPFMPILIESAQNDEDPELYAALIESKHSGAVEQIETWCNTEGDEAVFADFMAYFTELEPLRAWFRRLFTELVGEVQTPETGDDVKTE